MPPPGVRSAPQPLQGVACLPVPRYSGAFVPFPRPLQVTRNPPPGFECLPQSQLRDRVGQRAFAGRRLFEELTRAGVVHRAGHAGVPVDGFSEGRIGVLWGRDAARRYKAPGSDEAVRG